MGEGPPHRDLDGFKAVKTFLLSERNLRAGWRTPPDIVHVLYKTGVNKERGAFWETACRMIIFSLLPKEFDYEVICWVDDIEKVTCPTCKQEMKTPLLSNVEFPWLRISDK